MWALSKKLEVAANIAIIIVAILIGIVIIQRFLLPPAPLARVERTQIKKGDKIIIPDTNWDKNERTLLLVLSTTCKFCVSSSTFYQKLAQEKAKINNIGLIAMFPQTTSEAQEYLSEHNIVVDEIRQPDSTAVYADATPTLILVDRFGTVINFWIGKLPPEAENEVLKSFIVEQASS